VNKPQILLAGETLLPLPSGALWWPERRLLAVSDLHLGRSERTAREGGSLLPPYETRDTLDRLEAVIAETGPREVVLLGDSFDDMAALAALRETVVERLTGMAWGRRWIWIAGNHDPGPLELPGTYLGELDAGPLVFRHIALPGAVGEVSGHYHPKIRLRLRGSHIARPCFLADTNRVILPAFGTYTGGLDVHDSAFDGLFGPEARAYLTGRSVTVLPRHAEMLSALAGGRRGGRTV